MKKRKKGEDKMTTLTLGEIETRVKRNSSARKQTIDNFTSKIKKKNLNKGRVRPKDPIEAKILSMFSKK
ncbi:hypothetical protein C0966_04940 [Bacillus methanolicus]|uniref:hypothetical protein n=1 Tax=Bacillus methanolicus TaxID=1471 RepID=UPI0023801F3E|nr:hypothetical protein [Bacillus methanolicus]MDE3838726.1 hypothetical protein [Bacillus methanolicus]